MFLGVICRSRCEEGQSLSYLGVDEFAGYFLSSPFYYMQIKTAGDHKEGQIRQTPPRGSAQHVFLPGSEHQDCGVAGNEINEASCLGFQRL